MSNLLEVKNLTVDVGVGDERIRPLRGIDFSIKAGETLAIVGESGCGKSMTALSVMGLLPRSARCQRTASHSLVSRCWVSTDQGGGEFVAASSRWCSKTP